MVFHKISQTTKTGPIITKKQKQKRVNRTCDNQKTNCVKPLDF